MAWYHDVTIHEAGHAAVAVALGVAIDRVEISGTAGMCYLTGIYIPINEGQVYWAGSLAEARYRRGCSYLHWLSWLRDAEELLVHHGDGELLDRAVRDAWPDAKGADFNRRSHELCRAAMATLAHHWQAVLAIAAALSSKGRLTGDEVKQLYYHGAQVPAYNS